MKQWLSLSEAAKILGVHPGTVRNWADQGKIPVHRTPGGHRRFLRQEVEFWQQANSATSANENEQVIRNALRMTRYRVSEG
ncbi:MAG: helix-turn-helix domain-containing protein, partial [Anaerolineae bacterium]